MSQKPQQPTHPRRSPCGDSYGLLGFQSVVTQVADTPEATNLLLLTRGFDLNPLTLPVQQTEPLYPCMHSLAHDAPFTVRPEFHLPACYTVSSPKLNFQTFKRFHVETLFYIFYSMPRDVLQVAAAQELFNRDWRFHKTLMVWLTRTGKPPTIKTELQERGSFKFFNPDTWKQEERDDFLLEYSQLDELRPHESQQPSAAPAA